MFRTKSYEPMIFLEYFRRHIGKKVIITLKAGIEITGVLRNVDHFLNLMVASAMLRSTEYQSCPMQMLEVCSIRGSAVKFVDLEQNPMLERYISDATLLRFSFDK